MSVVDFIKKIARSIKTGETALILDPRGVLLLFHDVYLENMTVIKLIDVMSIIDCFAVETPRGKSLWMKQDVFLSFFRFP